MTAAPQVIIVRGTPAPQGSKRHVGRGIMVESSAKVKPWREAVKSACWQAEAVAVVFPAPTPVVVGVAFYLARPKGHYGTGRSAGEVKASAPQRPAVTPDLDKLLRSTLDGLGEGGLWTDDSQVVSVVAEKWYVCAEFTVPGARIVVSATGALHTLDGGVKTAGTPVMVGHDRAESAATFQPRAGAETSAAVETFTLGAMP